MLKQQAITKQLTRVLLSSLGYKGELDETRLHAGASMPLSCKSNSLFTTCHLYVKCSVVVLKFQTMFWSLESREATRFLKGWNNSQYLRCTCQGRYNTQYPAMVSLCFKFFGYCSVSRFNCFFFPYILKVACLCLWNWLYVQTEKDSVVHTCSLHIKSWMMLLKIPILSFDLVIHLTSWFVVCRWPIPWLPEWFLTSKLWSLVSVLWRRQWMGMLVPHHISPSEIIA